MGFGLAKEDCDLTMGGKPPPMAGEWFWGVAAGGGKFDGSVDLTSLPTIRVMVSARVGDIPFDRLGPEYIFSDQGMLDRLETFVDWLCGRQYEWMNLANEKLNKPDAEPVNGFIEPGFTIQLQDARTVGPDHWQSNATTEKLRSPLSPAGIVGELTIQNFKRVQYLEAVIDG